MAVGCFWVGFCGNLPAATRVAPQDCAGTWCKWGDNEGMRVPAEVVGKIDWHGCQLTACAGAPQDTLFLLLSSRPKNDRWRILCVSEKGDWEYTIETERSEFHFVQPLPDGLLLAHPRQSSPAQNACVYDFAGDLLRRFALGDGIQDLQTTASGDIWASYFDEGVFGDTVGSTGLVRFDAHGTPTYEFQPTAGLDWISDCYALNVESSEAVWFYYYTPFLLVRLRKDAIDGFWRTGVAGAQAFAVRGNLVVIHAGYQQNDWRLLQLHEDGTVSNVDQVEFVDEHGDPLPARCAKARGRLIWFVQNSTIYRADITKIR
jgi:hypothetical protein